MSFMLTTMKILRWIAVFAMFAVGMTMGRSAIDELATYICCKGATR